ncbi:MAG: hypothetical protein ABSF26_25815 [Thermoguttaceae bacterium]|jgi:hypothetical protein
MDDEPLQPDRFLEALDVCRSDSGDLGDPHLAPLAAALARDAGLRERLVRIARADAALTAAFDDVPVPVGLAQRLLERLAIGTPPAKSALPLPCSPAPLRRFSRRWLAIAAASLATAAALFVAALLGLRPSRPLTPDSLLEESMRLFSTASPGSGRLISETPPPANYPFSRDLLHMAQVRWRWVAGFPGGPAIAYDLPAVGDTRATLFVARQTVPGLPALPPLDPRWGTAGCSADAWQVGDTLYVLVVAGDSRAYRNYLDLSHAPLT